MHLPTCFRRQPEFRSLRSTLRLMIFLMTFVLGSLFAHTVQAQHLWYNDPGAGDIMLIDVNVTSTAATTYYETLGWNQGGEAGGYTGIQSHPKGNVFIFSIWDPIAVKGVPITAAFAQPNSIVENFGGEGTGLHYLNFNTPWTMNKPVTFAVRSWQYKQHTFFGMWARDSATGFWTHHTTFDFPVPNVSFAYGATSFLENWSGQETDKFRRAEFFNGWKRSNGKWTAFTRVDADQPGQFGSTPQNRFFLQTAGTPATGFTSPVNIPAVKGAPKFAPQHPVLDKPMWNAETKQLTVTWKTQPEGTPQFAFRVEVLAHKGKVPLASIADTVPHQRTATIDLSKVAELPKKIDLQLTITDILDHTTTAKTHWMP